MTTRYRILSRTGAPTAPRIAFRDTWCPRWLPRPLWALYVALMGWRAS